MTAKLAGSLPKRHGLDVIEDTLANHPHERHIVIAVIDCAKVVIDTDTDEAQPVARIRRIEVIRDEEAQSHAAALLQAAADRRKGIDPLPFDAYVIADALADMAEPDDRLP